MISLQIWMHMLKKREMLFTVTVTLGHEGCDYLLGESKVWLNTEKQTQTALGVWRLTVPQMLTAAKLQLSCDSPRTWELSELMEARPDFIEGKKERKYTKQSLSPKNCKHSPENVIPYISNSRTHVQSTASLIKKYLRKFYFLLGHVSWFWAPASGTAIGIIRLLWSQPDASLRLTGGNVEEKRRGITQIEKKNDDSLNTFESPQEREIRREFSFASFTKFVLVFNNFIRPYKTFFSHSERNTLN